LEGNWRSFSEKSNGWTAAFEKHEPYGTGGKLVLKINGRTLCSYTKGVIE
jgi:hypothetical protein